VKVMPQPAMMPYAMYQSVSIASVSLFMLSPCMYRCDHYSTQFTSGIYSVISVSCYTHIAIWLFHELTFPVLYSYYDLTFPWVDFSNYFSVQTAPSETNWLASSRLSGMTL
jgi:hypothetical protein